MPNRKERRAQRAAERRARRATGELPPAYYAAIERAAKLAAQWYSEHPNANPRWLPQKNDGVFIAATLDVGVRYLADNPAAEQLVAWVDAQTEWKLSLNQMVWALRRIRAIPMPDGSWYGVETVSESSGLAAVLKVTRQILDNPDAQHEVPDGVCPHCHAPSDRATGEDGKKPKPGDLSLCLLCAGFGQYELGDRGQLQIAGLSDATVEAMTGKQWAHFSDMQATLRGMLQKRAREILGGKESPEA